MIDRSADLPARSGPALAPVRAAIAADAAHRAGERKAQAEARAAEILQAAQTERERVIAAAASDGRAAGEIVARDRSARARRGAAEEVLAHREAARRALGDAVRSAATALRDDEDYPGILRRLEERARALLGADAVITEHPDGGVVAVEGSRRIDLSLPALADEVRLDAGGEIEDVWTG